MWLWEDSYFNGDSESKKELEIVIMRKIDGKFLVVDSYRKLIVRGRMINDGNNDYINNGSVSEKDRRKIDNDKLRVRVVIILIVILIE